MRNLVVAHFDGQAGAEGLHIQQPADVRKSGGGAAAAGRTKISVSMRVLSFAHREATAKK